jgi:hypothetical protein
MGNCPRIKPFTNTRMDARQFVHSWSIRGWSRMAKVNALRELQSTSGEELSALMSSILDKVSMGKL